MDTSLWKKCFHRAAERHETFCHAKASTCLSATERTGSNRALYRARAALPGTVRPRQAQAACRCGKGSSRRLILVPGWHERALVPPAAQRLEAEPSLNQLA